MKPATFMTGVCLLYFAFTALWVLHVELEGPLPVPPVHRTEMSLFLDSYGNEARLPHPQQVWADYGDVQ
jgi:hypothetical protein